MTSAATRLVAEHVLAAPGGLKVEASRVRLRCAQLQLILEERRQLRRDEVRRLCDEQRNSRIAEVATAPHLTNADVAVPVRDRAVACLRLEPDASQTIHGRNHDWYGRTIQRDDVHTVERMMPRVVLSRPPCSRTLDAPATVTVRRLVVSIAEVFGRAPPGCARRKSRSADALSNPPRVVPNSDATQRGMHRCR